MDKWEFHEPTKAEAYDNIKNDPRLSKKWTAYLKDVSENPFYHNKINRIVKLAGKTSFPPGSHRYRNDPLRVVYLPEKEDRIIYTLEAATATSVSYKKKTKGK